MKLEGDIINRLRKLKSRYLLRYLSKTQARVYHNCRHNKQHHPKMLTYGRSEPELNISPRKTNSLVVIRTAEVAHICTYGMSDEGWTGDLCDSKTDLAPHCKWFTPVVAADEVEREFEQLLKDDKYVLQHFPDIAALQWVTGKRIYNDSLGFFSRLIYALSLFLVKCWRKPAVLTEGAPKPKEDPPSSLWD